jgi:uncharacterized protein
MYSLSSMQSTEVFRFIRRPWLVPEMEPEYRENHAAEGMEVQAMKYMLLIGLALILLWLLRRPMRRSRTTEKSSARRPERMVQCVRCGVYLPESESLPDGAGHHCCAEHRQDRMD